MSWSHFIIFSEKQLRYNIISTLSKFVSAGLIN